MEKTVSKKVRMASASLSKFMLHSPSVIMVQTNQGAKSADCGARRIADTLCEKTNSLKDASGLKEFRETAFEIENRLHEIGKSRVHSSFSPVFFASSG